MLGSMLFEGQVSVQFRDIQSPNLAGIKKEVAMLYTEVYSLVESQILAIPLIIYSFAYPIPPH